MKSHNYNNPTGTDSGGPYWLNPETGEKLRWNGPMVGESQTWSQPLPITEDAKTLMEELIDKVEHAISYNVEGGLVEKYTWEELFHDMYALLEKEKKQIIELPSDEEIGKYIEKTFYGVKKHYFKAGVEFMKELILKQNK
jgi:hypothetical protein